MKDAAPATAAAFGGLIATAAPGPSSPGRLHAMSAAGLDHTFHDALRLTPRAKGLFDAASGRTTG